MPSLSVVICYFNRSQYIGETLASVWAQTRPPDEVIIIDDYSRPEEAAALDRLAGPARVVHLPQNVGLAQARNEGIKLATGDLIAFLDDDDIWLPEKLATQISYMDEHPETGMTHTAVTVFFRDGRETVYDQKPSPLALSSKSLRISYIVPSTIVVRREILDSVGLFDATFRLHEDIDLQIRCLSHGVRIDFLPAPLTRFRRFQHGNLSSKWRMHWKANRMLYDKHTDVFRQVFGRAASRLHLAYMLERCGDLRGGLAGKLMKVGGRMLSPGSPQTI